MHSAARRGRRRDSKSCRSATLFSPTWQFRFPSTNNSRPFTTRLSRLTRNRLFSGGIPVPRSTKLRFAVLISLLGLCLGSASATVPDWLKQAAAEKLPTYPAETKAVVLDDQTEITIEGPGQYVEHDRRILKILRPDGRDYAQLRVHLRQQDKLLSVHAWSIDSSGHEFEVKDKEFEDVANLPSEILYSDVRFRHARA